jgi:hypothetical protein
MPTPNAAHAGHDVLILAAAADHDPDPATLAVVDRMTASCPECAALAADLRSLASGLADLPPEVPAPRDFRITDVQAARLRQGGLLRRLLRPFGADGLPALRPLAGALTVVGLAGILLTSLPAGLQLGAGPAAAPAQNEDRSVSGAGAYGAAAPSTVPQAVTASSGANAGPGTKTDSPAPSVETVTPPQSSGTDTALGGSHPSAGTGSEAGNGAPVVVAHGPEASAFPMIPPAMLLSIAVLAIGLALVLLRVVARRID